MGKSYEYGTSECISNHSAGEHFQIICSSSVFVVNLYNQITYVKVKVMYVITASKRSLGQSNIFRSMCQEFCPRGEGGSALVHAGIRHPLGSRYPPWKQPPWTRHPPGTRFPWTRHPPRADPPQTRHRRSSACWEIR